MIIEDERDVALEPWRPPSDEVPIQVDVEVQPMTVDIITERLSRTLALRSGTAHERLKTDLVEHIWNRHGGDE
ncbi:hypothetical protein FRX31_035259 [Thalictrum thalictroides]|uniref:Uncharacterized protein n=1 Tax=Thalictrum thalictroides TaxID=46969 RepID=A0A7J6USC0_THATH|nr:hypothetical protein FRX31_035259 [Thalictrum thalictroides]